jgi:Holliday junction resolvase RusA-like endonuclease
MRSIRRKIVGVPYSQSYVGKNLPAIAWTQAIVDQTADLPLIIRPCLMRVTFLLPPSKFTANPVGNDLDNLLKRFCDALVKTVFRKAKGQDGIVMSLEATKTRVESDAEAGAELELICWPAT